MSKNADTNLDNKIQERNTSSIQTQQLKYKYRIRVSRTHHKKREISAEDQVDYKYYWQAKDCKD